MSWASACRSVTTSRRAGLRTWAPGTTFTTYLAATEAGCTSVPPRIHRSGDASPAAPRLGRPGPPPSAAGGRRAATAAPRRRPLRPGALPDAAGALRGGALGQGPGGGRRTLPVDHLAAPAPPARRRRRRVASAGT